MSNNKNQQIDATVQSFVNEISNLVRLAALEAVHSALGGGASAPRRGPGRPRGSGARRGPGRPKGSRNAAKAMPARAGRGGKRGRRSSKDVDATAAKFLAFVKSNDGKRLEEISKALRIPSANLKRPAQKLLAVKALRTTGQKRGTKYHVGKGSLPKALPAAPAKGAKKV